MTTAPRTILVAGGTGSVGRHVLAQLADSSSSTRALVRDPAAAGTLPDAIEPVVGDLAQPGTLTGALDGVDAVILTHAGHQAGLTETVDYGGVKNILNAVKGRTVRIVLMTAIGTTSRHQPYNLSTGVHDWKRRSEWLLRASGQPYVIVRPGWFDHNDDDQRELVFLQGDTRQEGTPADGVIAREQIAQVLIAAVTDEKATSKTFELVAEQGQAQDNLTPLFEALAPDVEGSIHGVRENDNFPLSEQPGSVLADLDAVRP
jgi:uncharacterized protein YbjT (DUF2867 family)